ncbi:MAG: hypothetical protein H7293_03285 [Candidatus Saccharibacteria bacterium]|nr:hypothetical protein [Rhodoferax sp.]
MSDRKDLPPATATNFLARVREEITIMMGNRGEPLDQAVRFKDLYDSNLLRLDPAFLAGNRGNGPIISGNAPGAAPSVYVADLTPPPTPTGFTATAAISNLMLQTDAPLFTVGHGYQRTVLYGASRTSLAAPAPTYANAVELTQFIGTVGAYPTNPATIWHLWVKWRTVDGVLSESPAGGINGVMVTTAVDVTRLVAALTGPGNPFKVITTSYTLADGTVVPVGTYTSDAYMGSFVAARGQIGLLAVDDARIASMSVAKLAAGSISVGAFINSSNYISGSQGWSINGNGQAEFSGVVVRGTVYASAGVFSGTVYASAGVFSGTVYASDGSFTGSINATSGNFRGSVNTGDFTSYNWPTNGGGGSHLSSLGLLVGNYNSGKYFQITSVGDIYAPQFSIVNGTATFAGNLSAAGGSFSGNLNAASGSFSGSLTASAVNAVNTINLAGNAVTTQASSAGTGGASVALYIPPYQTMRIVGFASASFQDFVTTGSLAELYINGSLAASTQSPTLTSGDASTCAPGLTVFAAKEVYGGAGGMNVVISGNGTRLVNVAAFGALR